MTFRQLFTQAKLLSKSERSWIVVLVLGIALFTVLDVIEDWEDGSPLSHIIPEVFVIFACSSAGMVLLLRLIGSRHEFLESTRGELEAAKSEAALWRQKTAGLSRGVSDAISEQLASWGMTPAEQDISFLLIKGLSTKEIAAVRETSERTIRQQSSEIYRKSGLSGRAQLAAFFIEDLLQERVDRD